MDPYLFAETSPPTIIGDVKEAGGEISFGLWKEMEKKVMKESVTLREIAVSSPTPEILPYEWN